MEILENAMLYSSTRGNAPARSLRELLNRGTAEDGGLYAPEAWPELTASELSAMGEQAYDQIASDVLALFGGDDWQQSDFSAGIRKALAGFERSDGPPLHHLEDQLWSMELFHGPTFAFKDYALAPLAEAIDRELTISGKRATVLCATSGDTGAATANAFAGRSQANAVILFPEGRVSDVQRRQMTCLGASNVQAISVRGDFDDCQSIVKSLYQSEAAKEYSYTAVNSINLARILLQTSYYIYASVKIHAECGQSVNFAVPSGNFGNIFAGYIAKQMGAPIGKLIVTSNENDVLPRLFETGMMSKAETIPTISPSMDIQVSSNFERMLWILKGRDGTATRDMQKQLAERSFYELSQSEHSKLTKDFGAMKCGKGDALDTMRQIHEQFGKIICPHSATGYFAADQLKATLDGPIVVTETAHPAKFPTAVEEALGMLPDTPARLEDLFACEEEFVTVSPTVEAVQSVIDGKFGTP
ncbi:threonine synthase [Tropicibacter sp. R16_0]|nr:threonine synthase [Tropicibacter sp. R16_0]